MFLAQAVVLLLFVIYVAIAALCVLDSFLHHRRDLNDFSVRVIFAAAWPVVIGLALTIVLVQKAKDRADA